MYVVRLGSLALGFGLKRGGSTLGRHSRAAVPPDSGDDLKGARLGTRSGLSRLCLSEYVLNEWTSHAGMSHSI